MFGTIIKMNTDSEAAQEDMLSLDSLDNICRACMDMGGSVSLFSYDNSVQLATKIMAVAMVEISANEHLPSAICSSCVDKLNISYHFKLLCESTELKLRGYIESSKIENDEPCMSDYYIKNEDPLNWPPNTELRTILHNTESGLPVNNISAINAKSIHDEQKLYQISAKRSIKKYSLKSLIHRKTTHKKSKIEKIATRERTLKTKNIILSDDEMLTIKPKQKKKRRLTKYMCETCGSVFNDKSSLRIHNRYHTGERPFVCSVCSKGFAVEINLKTHMRCHSGEKPYVCDVCGRGFSVAASLRGHIRTHTGERPYKCTTCTKTFAQRSNLRTHMRIHTGDKPHKCKICEKAFSTTSDLNQHNRSHTGEKPYACHLCPKRFSMASNLTIHIRIHSGQKDYECTLCQKTFICKASLNSHMRVHTGVKAYSCNVCEKRFAHANTLSAHIVVHTGTRNFECELCHKKFARSSSLSAHRKKHKLC